MTANGYDAALRRLHERAPTFSGWGTAGLSNHGPMVIEALATLEREDGIEPFLEGYLPKLDPFPPGKVQSDWRRALGNADAAADLIATFEGAVENAGVEVVVRDALPTLVESMVAAAFHGPLRLAHALRAWRRRDTPDRRREVAHALGYWASSFQELPGEVGDEPRWDALTALQKIEPLEGAPRNRGLIIDRFSGLDTHPSYLSALAGFDARAAGFDQTVVALARGAAELTVVQPSRFIYLHGVTGSSTLQLLAPYLDEATKRRALERTLQALAAVHAAHVGEPRPPRQGNVPTFETLVERAVASRDDHQIKLVEATRRLDAAAPDALWRRAAYAHIGG